MVARAFEVVPDDPSPPNPAPGGNPPPKTNHNAALVGALMLAIATISKRAFIALLDTFSLITAASAFWLFFSFTNPTIYQIVHATIYALFILAINWIVRKQS